MDFSFTEEQRMMRESVRTLMDRIATPEYVRRLDREQAYPQELYDAWVGLGLLRIPFEEKYGGLGGSVMDLVIVAEEISRKSADFFMPQKTLKRHWLPKLLSGEIDILISPERSFGSQWRFCSSEPLRATFMPQKTLPA